MHTGWSTSTWVTTTLVVLQGRLGKFNINQELRAAASPNPNDVSLTSPSGADKKSDQEHGIVRIKCNYSGLV